MLISPGGLPLIFCGRVMLGVCAAGAIEFKESANREGSGVDLTRVDDDAATEAEADIRGLPAGAVMRVTAGVPKLFDGRGISGNAGSDNF